jgi:hypothetical protein
MAKRFEAEIFGFVYMGVTYGPVSGALYVCFDESLNLRGCWRLKNGCSESVKSWVACSLKLSSALAEISPALHHQMFISDFIKHPTEMRPKL